MNIILPAYKMEVIWAPQDPCFTVSTPVGVVVAVVPAVVAAVIVVDHVECSKQYRGSNSKHFDLRWTVLEVRGSQIEKC